jgi:hypothetical protein
MTSIRHFLPTGYAESEHRTAKSETSAFHPLLPLELPQTAGRLVRASRDGHVTRDADDGLLTDEQTPFID